MNLLKKEMPLWIILVVMLAKGIIWMSLIPPLQTPDEQSHFAYVQYMGEENKIPVQTSETSYSHEFTLFTMAVHLNDIVLKPEAKYRVEKKFSDMLNDPVNNNPEKRKSTGSNLVSGYPPAYYFLASTAYKIGYDQSIFFRFYAVRSVSVLLSLIAVGMAYFIGKRIEPKSSFMASVLAIMVGMQPMFSMIGSAVNNDILMDVMSIAILLWLLLIFEKVTNKRLIIGGMLIGIGLLVKLQMLFIGGTILLVVFVVFMKKYKLAYTLKSAIYVIVPILVLFIPWAIFSYSHYHSFFGGFGSAMQPHGDPTHGLTWYIKNSFLNSAGRERLFDLLIKMYWAKFGWLDTKFSSVWLYKLLAVVMVIGFIGSIYGVIRRKDNYKFVGICLFFVLCNAAFLYIVEIMYFMEYHNFMLQGRYFLTSLVPINIILLYGFRYLMPIRFKNYVYYSFALGMILFNMSSIDLLYRRYY